MWRQMVQPVFKREREAPYIGENIEFPGCSGFFGFFLIFDIFWPLWGPGDIPLHSQRNFDPDGGPETPRRPFFIHFKSFLDIFALLVSEIPTLFEKVDPSRLLRTIPQVENDRILIL